MGKHIWVLAVESTLGIFFLGKQRIRRTEILAADGQKGLGMWHQGNKDECQVLKLYGIREVINERHLVPSGTCQNGC